MVFDITALGAGTAAILSVLFGFWRVLDRIRGQEIEKQKLCYRVEKLESDVSKMERIYKKLDSIDICLNKMRLDMERAHGEISQRIVRIEERNIAAAKNAGTGTTSKR